MGFYVVGKKQDILDGLLTKMRDSKTDEEFHKAVSCYLVALEGKEIPPVKGDDEQVN